MTTERTLARREAKQREMESALESFARGFEAIARNPATAGLLALAVNHALYRLGVFDPRPSDWRWVPGSTPTPSPTPGMIPDAGGHWEAVYEWKQKESGFSPDGGFHLDIMHQEWQETTRERIAAQQVSNNDTMITVAAIAYAAAPAVSGGLAALGGILKSATVAKP